MDLTQRIEKLKTRGIDNEEFFLIYNGSWCAGYMFTPGLNCEMDVQLEVTAETIDAALTELEQNLKGKQQ